MSIIRKPKILCSDWILGQFDRDIVTARKSYRELVLAGIKKASPWKDLKGRIFLGKEDFKEEIGKFLKEKELIEKDL